MSEMLQRVATAIFVSADDAHNTWPSPDNPECQHMAKMAIEALFDPPPSVLARLADTDQLPPVGDPAQAWNKLIEALK